jgi:hypothetical protein
MRLETPSDALVSISNGVVEPLETPAPPEPVDSNVFLGLEDAETVSRLLESGLRVPFVRLADAQRPSF